MELQRSNTICTRKLLLIMCAVGVTVHSLFSMPLRTDLGVRCSFWLVLGVCVQHGILIVASGHSGRV